MSYHCNNCDKKFSRPLIHNERHGFSHPPYEVVELCPYCLVADVCEIEEDNTQDDAEDEEDNEEV